MRCVNRIALIVVLVCTSKSFGKEVDPEVQKWLQELGTREEVRFQALNKLVQLGEKSIEPTRRVMNDTNQHFSRRWQAAKVLGALKAKVAVPDLLKIVKGNDNLIVKRVAAEALGRIGDRSVVQELEKVLAKQDDALVKQSIRRTLAVLAADAPSSPEDR